MPPTAAADEPKTAAPNPPLRGKHVAAAGATTAPKRTAASTPKPNGTGRDTAKAAPSDPTAARINAEKKRLSPDSIRNIRERAADDVPPRRIARDFGISKETVRALAG